MYGNIDEGFFDYDSRVGIRELESKRSVLLRDKEESWRLKSRVIWLQASDENTKCFQNYDKDCKK